jgi:dCTP diphosphatase
MSDTETTVAELRALVRDFVERREWRQFHAPKNLAMSLAIEAAELMEHFQWISAEESREIAGDSQTIGEVSDELADVFCYALSMASELNIDVSTAIRRKMVKNEKKYPAGEFRGRAK